MISRNYLGVATLGDISTTQGTHTKLMNAAMPFFFALYGQPPGTSMESARQNIFNKEDEKTKAMASQLFYRISWPHVSSPSERIASNEEHLSNNFEASKKIVIFDKYQDISAKDQDRMRQDSGAVLDDGISIASHLPFRDAKMKIKSNKRKFANV